MKFINGNENKTQTEANMNVVHNILNGIDELSSPVQKLAMVA